MKKLLKWIFIILFVFPAIFGFLVSLSKNTKEEKEVVNNTENKQKIEQSKDDFKSKIIENAYFAMTKKDNPKTYKAWGSEWIKKINDLGPLAGELVAKSRSCDKVVDIALSDTKSKPKKKIVFYVDCKNKERFYISEDDIKSQNKVFSVNESFKNIDSEKYYKACLSGIKSRANHPSTVETSIFGRAIGSTPTGGVLVRMDFTAKNSFGLEEKFTAACSWDDDKSEINIYNR
ncbi:hypothetical protein [Pasteurella multocida]|uniref:hypothetical protein n=1 Tax=Pasteurella multocida TaxID=747 RepID=UPI000E3079B2|nr:hypothetical protein [Pasteurella multocida]AXN95898.1 hypothetical protein DYY62_08580 [Pasteurella multocida]AXN99701.1 hypothetical protein DYY61_08050 [Pasteurella multocida]AXO01911.1 hypothetical protein DYY63_08050 [Pasteurella multocida]AXO04130.1 hypothetical protein DYY64_08055 [Pasteurella multocida]QDA24705.1 hypothetical protein FHZ86_08050 [Pasteurella multocida]